jgi:hypothetical protein
MVFSFMKSNGYFYYEKGREVDYICAEADGRTERRATKGDYKLTVSCVFRPPKDYEESLVGKGFGRQVAAKVVLDFLLSFRFFSLAHFLGHLQL